MTTRLERNAVKMRLAGASETEVQDYLHSERNGRHIIPRLHNRPDGRTTTAQRADELIGKYGLERAS